MFSLPLAARFNGLGGQDFSIRTGVLAGGTQQILKVVQVPPQTEVQVDIVWSCGDSDGGRVGGNTSIVASRETGAAYLETAGNIEGANFIDTTTGYPTPWNPTVALVGNELRVMITPDSLNDMMVHLEGQVVSTDFSTLPPSVDPTPILRATLLGTGPEFMLDAYTDRTPSSSVPGTVITQWGDQSGNAHNAASGGANVITYTPDGNSKPALLTPALANTLDLVGALPVSTSWQFAICLNINKNPAAAIEVWLSDQVGGDLHYWGVVAGNITYTELGSVSHPLQAMQNGIHTFGVVADAAAGTVTPYLDGVPGAPEAYASLTPWTTPSISGTRATHGASFPMVSNDLYAVCGWSNATSVATKMAAFHAFCQAAFGAP